MASLLIKFGEKKYLDIMLLDGKLHCKSIKWFAEHEDGKLRGDEFEAVTKTQYIENITIQLREADNPDAEWKLLDTRKMLYKEYHKDPLGNLFCMSMFPVNEGTYKIDQRFALFGGHMLLIHNQVEFFKRVEDTLTMMNVGFCRGNVQYLDLHKHTGEKKLYQKDMKYSFQQEYRIHLHRDFTDTFEFSIGSIEDIAVILSCEDVRSFLVRKQGTVYECCPLV